MATSHQADLASPMAIGPRGHESVATFWQHTAACCAVQRHHSTLHTVLCATVLCMFIVRGWYQCRKLA